MDMLVRYLSAPARHARRSRRSGMLALVAALVLVSGASAQQASTFTPREENPDEFPAGKGRDETFYTCTACHNFKLVAQQGMNRRQWDDTLTWMTEKQGMPALEGEDRKLVLDYLEAAYPPTGPGGAGSSPNPFLKQ